MRPTVVLLPCMFFVGAMLGTEFCHAQPSPTELVPDNLSREDLYGYSVAGEGDFVFIGAPWDDAYGLQQGSITIFQRDDDGDWKEFQQFSADDGISAGGDWDEIGTSLAVSGDVLVSGAPRSDYVVSKDPYVYVGAGAGWVFRWNEDDEEWQEEQRLAVDGGGEDRWSFFAIGYSCDTDGSRIILGDPWDNEACDFDSSEVFCRSGSAYIFKFQEADGVDDDGDGDTEDDEWVQEQRLTSGSPAELERFGSSVAIFGDVAVVGTDNFGSVSGLDDTLYIFRFDADSEEWVEEETLTTDRLGFSLEIAEDLILAGANESVLVYRYEDEEWSQEQAIKSDSARAFGRSISLRGDSLLVGAPATGTHDELYGSVHLITYDESLDEGERWVEVESIDAVDPEDGMRFGSSVSLGSGDILVGAYRRDGASRNEGSAYVYPIDCNDNDVPDPVDIHNGTSPDENCNRIPDECDIEDGISEDENENDIPDEAENEFIRGDVTGNGVVSPLPDALRLLKWAFLDEEKPPCMDAADVDDNGDVNALLDALFLLKWAFLEGDEPPAPGTEKCGIDPTEDCVMCVSPPDCS